MYSDLCNPTQKDAHMLATTDFRLATKFAFISLFTVNLYDHILTFSDEVKYIWQRKITPGILVLLSSSLLHVLNTVTFSHHHILHRRYSRLSPPSTIEHRRYQNRYIALGIFCVVIAGKFDLSLKFQHLILVRLLFPSYRQ